MNEEGMSKIMFKMIEGGTSDPYKTIEIDRRYVHVKVNNVVN